VLHRGIHQGKSRHVWERCLEADGVKGICFQGSTDHDKSGRGMYETKKKKLKMI